MIKTTPFEMVFIIRDSYELNISNPQDEIVALAVVLTIDCVMAAQSSAAASSSN